MADEGAVVAIYNTHGEAEAAVKELETTGIDGDLCEQSTAPTNHSDGGHPWARR
jgi:hypothetical protein